MIMSKFILLTAAAVATATGTITKSFNDRTDQDFDEYLKSVKNKDLSPRLKKLKKSLLIKSPFQKKTVQSKTV